MSPLICLKCLHQRGRLAMLGRVWGPARFIPATGYRAAAGLPKALATSLALVYARTGMGNDMTQPSRRLALALPDYPTTRHDPDYPTSRRLAPTTRLPDYPTTRLPDYPTTRLPDYPTTRLPDYPTTRLPDYRAPLAEQQPTARRRC